MEKNSKELLFVIKIKIEMDITKKNSAYYLKNFFKYFFLCLLFLIIMFTLIVIVVNKVKTPLNDRNWNLDQQIMAYVKFDSENSNLI